MLWILDHVEQLNPEEVLVCLPFVSEARRKRILSMGDRTARVCSALAELLLRHSLRAEYGLTDLPRIETGEKGKPFFPDRPDLHFNLSHCKTTVACALDRTPVGVDVQEIRPLRRQDGPPAVFRVLSDSERAWVTAGETEAEQARRFTAVWTCKEAWGKAKGLGFLYDMKTTDFCPTSALWQQYGCSFQHWDLGGTFLALCAAAPMELRTVSFSDMNRNWNTDLEE